MYGLFEFMAMNVASHVVGRLYSPERTIWPERAQLAIRGDELELALFRDQPSYQEVEAVRIGRAEFGLYVDRDLVVLCYHFYGHAGDIPWRDAPYSWHRVPAAERGAVPDVAQLGPDTRAVLHVVLVDAMGGDIRAVRQLSLSPTFTRSLYAAIANQAALPWEPDDYTRRLLKLMRRHPLTTSLVAASAAWCDGGA
jgi:hypothetical protein